ncbi:MULTISPECIES: HalOD1 output domain-containing protein [Salinibaculum]|uniref:HalOD1 output domain-containing protein n=1 Tax=Salinibaculum TaxID=2732368 RepID=UPI0030CEF696
MDTEARAVVPEESPETLTEAIVEAVAEAEGIDPIELRPSLYDVVDPDALELLYAQPDRSRASNLRVTFAYGTWQVHVHRDGTVQLTEHGQPGPDSRKHR